MHSDFNAFDNVLLSELAVYASSKSVSEEDAWRDAIRRKNLVLDGNHLQQLLLQSVLSDHPNTLSKCNPDVSVNDEYGDLTAEEEQIILESQDPSRIAPKSFLKIPNALRAIVLEMNTVTAKDARGIPNLLAVNLKDDRYKSLPRVFCTVVVKKKTPLVYKARLCARGDMLDNFTTEDVSAPTTARASPRLLISLALLWGLRLGLLDVSSAFTQSDYVEGE